MPRFPLDEQSREAIAHSMVNLCSLAVAAGLQGQLFLQSWKLSAETGNNVVTAHLPQWQPRRGLGIWPAGPAPTGWTEESLMNAAAAAFQGQEPRLPVHHLLQLRTDNQQLPSAVRKMTGRGVALVVFSKQDRSESLERNAGFYRDQVEGRFKRSPFFMPLLDETGLLSFSGADHTEQWMHGLDIYVRETAEDEGVLIVSRAAYTHVIDEWLRVATDHRQTAAEIRDALADAPRSVSG
ncbi:hypothetical protein [Terriglobus aquaticus]|uniref:DUF5753 domain-containing protein n=1 Tax=Terriglobus aquaticus TaxID=940139 RepID=A0ABW9KGT2_9BACT|nr:hypothetical protein [Terriglobus aquaticus]